MAFAAALLDFDEQNSPSFLPPNPRKIKALANQANSWYEIIKPLKIEDKVKIQALVVICYVHQFHGELYQRWQYNHGFFVKIRNWVLNESKDDSSRDYFQGLELPYQTTKTTDEHQNITPTVPSQTSNNASSTYPNPSAINVFWVQPLITNQLPKDDVIAIMQALTHRQS